MIGNSNETTFYSTAVFVALHLCMSWTLICALKNYSKSRGVMTSHDNISFDTVTETDKFCNVTSILEFHLPMPVSVL